MKKIIKFLSFITLLSACNNAHDHTHETEAVTVSNQAATEEQGEEAMLTQEQMKKIHLKMGPVEYKNLQATLKVNGKLELPPQNKATVSPLIGGVVTRVHVRQGQFIKKGGLLATLTNPEFINLQEKYLASSANLDFLEKEYNRLTALVEKEIAAERKLESVQSEKAAEAAELKALTAKMKLIGLPIPQSAEADFASTIALTSPLNGYVQLINTNTGSYVEPTTPVFEIVDNHHIHIDLMVFEQDIHHVHVDQKINFMLQSNPREVMEARIFAIGKALETKERAVRVHAEIENNKGNLLPGMYVEARIILEDKTTACLPEEAITTDKGLQYIFVKEEEHEDEVHFLKVQVLTGATDAGYVAITPMEDLAENAEIVLEGAFFLMAQTKKDEGGGGHHH